MIGTLSSIQGTSATFAVETWKPNPDGTALNGPPAPGATAVVHYAENEIAFLRVGRRYAVAVYPGDDGISSGVHHADDACSGGTIYASGKSIDTSVWSRSIVHRTIIGFALFVVAVLALLTLITLRNRRRLLATRVLKERPNS